MSSVHGTTESFGAFGANAWLVEEKYEEFLEDPEAVGPSWRDFFEDYRTEGELAAKAPADGQTESGPAWKAAGPGPGPGPGPGAGEGVGEGAPRRSAPGSEVPRRSAPGSEVPRRSAPGSEVPKESEAPRRSAPGSEVPKESEAPKGGERTNELEAPKGPKTDSPSEDGLSPAPEAEKAAPALVQPLRGAAARIATNMVASLAVPTATSIRPIPAKLLEVNRSLLNKYLARTRGGKVSFTHLIGYAVVRALRDVPAMNASYVEDSDGKGNPGVLHHEHVGLGIAVDVQKSDGSRSLLVPCVRDADTLAFRAFVAAYEELIRKVHTNKLSVDDFTGVTVTLTNPGTLGTAGSVPRLMPGQGAIVATGTIDFPPELQAADPEVVAAFGFSKSITLTSTYDHRIIQGAESGIFLGRVHDLLLGADGFYEDAFSSMGAPLRPMVWERDRNPVAGTELATLKQVHFGSLVNMYRVRGHLIAHLDPLAESPPPMHSELDPAAYGLTVWDLDRRFLIEGPHGPQYRTLGETLDMLQEAYCHSIGVEYMHIQDPEQKHWIQRNVEGVPTDLPQQEQLHILGRLNAAEAFERFLHTRYVGQKRFGLEGGESAIALLDGLLNEAADNGLEECVMGMAHRGRLNVMVNIVGKSYEEMFAEFEGNLDPESVQGSGDVKYHKGCSGTFTGLSGRPLTVHLAANPSHLEAVDPVVEGMARARQDVLRRERGMRVAPMPDEAVDRVLPLLIHGDAAFAGQGVVAETLNLSALLGYRTGGTVHLVINNQVGFTTDPAAGRSSVYSTDVAKMVQAPIFHVNGDDPEACVRVGKLALAYRQAFHRDVVIDMVCYRRFGHNEGDEPSYTQPQMYEKIDRHRSVRKLYTETLVRRGDITLEEAEKALDDFQQKLQTALDATRSSAPPGVSTLPAPHLPSAPPGPDTAFDPESLDWLARHLASVPEGFTAHPKLVGQLESRAKLFAEGSVDWGLAEALAYGSLLLEGRDVRLAGQDTRRGTFSHRHAVLIDYRTGAEYAPLAELQAAPGVAPDVEAGRFFVYDSSLSEFAALGFEYGYSVGSPGALVAWEAQFGDFINGAQSIIDEFVVAAAEKWEQESSLVMLLPHGYEGQGPDHSSARLERFLQLAAGDNIWVVYPTTAAQCFHLLRLQALRAAAGWRRPLVVMSPKSLLRARPVRSGVGELSSGSFREVIDDPAFTDGAASPASIRRVVLTSGKIAYEAFSRRDSDGEAPLVALVRVEQLYPWPETALAEVLGRYSSAEEVVWLQEEPENMGAWDFVHEKLHSLLRDGRRLAHISRRESGSPATGSAALHRLEVDDLLSRALGTASA